MQQIIKKIKPFINQYWFTVIVIFLFWICVEGLFSYNRNLRESVKELKGKIKQLEIEKKNLEFDNFKLVDSLFWSGLVIEKLKEREGQFITENTDLKYQIKLLKDKYEKANNTANNYTADSIRKYFSNIK